jgi:hypothetical protein
MNRSRQRALKRELAKAYGRMDELETHVTYGLNLADGRPTPGREEKLRRNGIFTAAAKYAVKRVDDRRLKKNLEKALKAEAVAKARVETARKALAR